MMTNNLQTDGLIIRQSNYKEADRMLTLLTPEHGIIQAAARGVRKMKRCRTASSQLFCYSEFDLYTGGDIAVVNGSSIKDAFCPISEDIEKLSLFTYLADITYAAIGEHNPEPEITSLFLNSLYAAAYKNISTNKIKPVFEIRLMRLCGLMPDILHCSRCGAGAEEGQYFGYFGVNDAIVCDKCRVKGDIAISPEAYACMYYILYSMPKKIYSFKAPDRAFEELSSISEKYVSCRLERKFSSLDYYKKISVRAF
ncbi:MAG: DNA repair protein RecO [Oscillospiraceae bacterium]|nr:DNA repair protein RecO [Oscillospiraceae bacterium]